MKNHLFVLFLCLASAGAWAQQFPSLEPVPAAWDYARTAASPRWQDLAASSLWASSVNAGPGAEEKAASFMDRITAAAAELTALSGLPAQPKERGEYVLAFMHRRFLKSYSEYQTRVDEIFVSGRYNCVSSAVLYMVLGRSVGLDVGAVMTKDHAFATVNTGTELIDVETTNPYGFDPGNRKEFHDAFGKATGFAYVPAKNYRDRTVISGAELVSLILSNRISVLERGNRFADAVPLAINRMVFLTGSLDSDDSTGSASSRREFFDSPRQDMMSRLTNLGASFIRTGKEDEAIAWADYAGRRFPDPARWQELILAAANNKLVKYIRAKKIPDARTALAALQPYLSEANYRTLDDMVLEAEAVDRVSGIKNPGDVEAALAFLSQVWERLPVQQRNDMRITAILAEAERFNKARNWKGGMDWLVSTMEHYGSSVKLESALRTLRQNRISELHNGFAVLFNKRDYDGAQKAVQKALEEFPNERQFLADQNMVERALKQQEQVR